GLDDFERHFAADRFLLLGHEDDAEAAFTDLLQELVGSDDGAGALGDWVVAGRDPLPPPPPPPKGRGGGLPEIARLERSANQFLPPREQLGVAATGLSEVGGPRLGRIKLDGGTENGIEGRLLVDHGSTPGEAPSKNSASF